MTFWDAVWFVVLTFTFVAYLMVLLFIITDLFGDHALNWWLKTVWMLALVFVPFLTALVYVIARGKGMTERKVGSYAEAKKEEEAYAKAVAGEMTPADEMAKAKSMYDAGTITEGEYESLKHNALT